MGNTAETTEEAATKREGRRRRARVEDHTSRSHRLEHDSQHDYHPRRRKKRRSSASDGNHAYESVFKNNGGLSAHRSDQKPPQSVVKELRTSSAPVPERVSILRTLGLERPQPSNSRQTRRASSEVPQTRVMKTRSAQTRRQENRAVKPASDLKEPRSVPRRSVPRRLASPKAHFSFRSTSLRERSSRMRSRSTLGRSSTTVRRAKRMSTPLPAVVEEPKSSPSKGLQQSTSVFGSLFGPPRPAVPEIKSVQTHSRKSLYSSTNNRSVECLTCLDEVPISRAPKLTCGHRMCHECLKRIFTMSVTDPAHMPPKCCTEDCIPLKNVDKLFDTKFKVKWNKKYQEYTSKNRIYCPARKCGTWIPPRDIHIDHSGGPNGGRKYGICPRCRTQVCATCNGRRHKSRECPRDESTARFAEMAQQNGWQRCYNCSAMVELKEGCNHMRCRCTAEFCMICAKAWKTCDCPWFNYAAVEADRLEHMNIPQVRQAMANGGNPAFIPPRGYQEEMEQRREQERLDAEMARRLERLGLELEHQRQNEPPGGLWGVGTGAGHFLNENFVPRAMDFLTGFVNNPAQQAATDNVAAQIRGQHRVDADATGGIEIPGYPYPAASPPRPQRPSGFRRSATMRGGGSAAIRRDVDQRVTPEDSAAAARSPLRLAANRGPAVLAGLNRGFGLGRVDAWRQHVSGDDGSSAAAA